ncbi:hypothetical protein KO353_08115 [Elioraea tepida]|uniref:Uncharacterized protein n=1 Tax=Elioraea tepida TaxID=2843330 RepID=A0A975U5V4_9PROT|nr:hypothetical protein KO353_08115 [Elioraea tepida]
MRPGFIRVEADEVTYPAHIILSLVRLERALVSVLISRSRPHRSPGTRDEGSARPLGTCRNDRRDAASRTSTGMTAAFGYFPLLHARAMAAAGAAVPGWRWR